MLDVHPAHHAATTWRDFFIHIATIILGLLIAIGLEQTVEYLHRQHQRHQLEEDLRAEGIRNLKNVIGALDRLDVTIRWQTQQALELDRADAEGRTPVWIPSPPMPSGVYSRPSDSVWTVAQTSATLNLLPRSEAERYSHPYFNVKMVDDQLEKLNTAGAERLDTLTAASSQPEANPSTAEVTFDLSRLSKENRVRFREATGRMVVAARLQVSYNLNLYALTWGTLQGHTDDENTRLMTDVRTTYYQEGGTASVLKKYPIPTESTNMNTEDK